MDTYGYEETAWRNAKMEARAFILGLPRRGAATTTYSTLCENIHAIKFAPESYDLARLLDQLSAESFAEGLGMISALVVRKNGGLPGSGFFDLARSLGRDFLDDQMFWDDEHANVIRRILAVTKRMGVRPVTDAPFAQ